MSSDTLMANSEGSLPAKRSRTGGRRKQDRVGYSGAQRTAFSLHVTELAKEPWGRCLCKSDHQSIGSKARPLAQNKVEHDRSRGLHHIHATCVGRGRGDAESRRTNINLDGLSNGIAVISLVP
jgi:hypothetical protein